MTVLPSFEEGFGLPVLESMACGTPVACSNGASLPEVGGHAAEYFDPKDQDSICDALEKVLLSNDLRTEMRRRGLQQAQRFTWQACSELHCEVYKRFLMEQRVFELNHDRELSTIWYHSLQILPGESAYAPSAIFWNVNLV